MTSQEITELADEILLDMIEVASYKLNLAQTKADYTETVEYRRDLDGLKHEALQRMKYRRRPRFRF